MCSGRYYGMDHIIHKLIAGRLVAVEAKAIGAKADFDVQSR
jgi:uncharacterized protein (DUF39 family)